MKNYPGSLTFVKPLLTTAPRSCIYRMFVSLNILKEGALVVQIETSASVERAEEIAAVAGVDVLFIGPLDLSVNIEEI